MRRIVALLVALATVAALYLLVWRVARANRSLRQLYITTQLAVARDTDEVTRARRAREDLAALDGLVTHSPLDQLTYSLAGKNAFAVGRTEDAEKWYSAALSWGDRPELTLALADAQAANGKTETAIRGMLHVARFDPYTLTRTENAYLRQVALQRLDATVTPRMRAEVYLNMAIGYLTDGFQDEAASMIATGALSDPSIIVRPELANWGGYPTALALQRYRSMREAARTPR
jgi:tetratricopeptide (TPR) repeat protein